MAKYFLVNQTVLCRLFLFCLGFGGVSCAHRPGQENRFEALVRMEPSVAMGVMLEVPTGRTRADIYLPGDPWDKPLVIVAHGFSRSRANMAGWGRFFANAGVIAVVPDLPFRSGHDRNARFLVDLAGRLRQQDALWDWQGTQVGLAGFSAGGLSTLLAAAELPGLCFWIGLDPVDRNDLGLAAAPRVACPAWVLLADPSPCNAHGNAAVWAEVLPRAQQVRIVGASHVDGEHPTDFLAERICGASTPQQRLAFQNEVRSALRSVGWIP